MATVAELTRPAPGPMAPRPFRVVAAPARDAPTRGRSSSSRSTGAPLDVRARPVHDALRVRGRRGADLGLAASAAGRSSTPSAPSARSPRRSARRGRAPCSACAARSATRWPVDEARRRRRRRRRRRDRARPAAPGASTTCLAQPRRVRRGRPALRQPHAGRPALSRASSSAGAAASTSRSTSPSTAAETGWRGKVGVVPKLIASARASTRRRRVALVCGPEIMMRFAARGAPRARRRPPSGSTSRWSATCSAASATAATASSARR